MIMSETTFQSLQEYVHDWYDSLNDAHEHALTHLVYMYMDAIMEFSDDYE